MSIHDCIQNIFFATVYGQAQNQGLAVSMARYQATGGPDPYLSQASQLNNMFHGLSLAIFMDQPGL